MTTTAVSSLAEAWLRRYQEAATELAHAASAPALFKPEYVEQVQRKAERARSEYLRWATEVA